MAILLVDAGAAAPGLTDLLARHGLSAVPTSASVSVENDARSTELLVYTGSGADELLARTVAANEKCPGVPVAWRVPGRLDADTLRKAMRLGVIDVIDSTAPASEQAQELAAAAHRIVQQRSWLRAETTSPATIARANAKQLRTEAQLRDLQRDQRAGRYIQMGMLPPSPMAIDGYRLRHKIIPSLMLSGDFVDYFRITDTHFGFYIADVSGHGASSAFVTVLLKNFSRRLRREYTQRMLQLPGEILVWLNRELLDNQLDKHVAMIVGIVDLSSNELMFANGGHYPNAILVDNAHGARSLELIGKPVGLFREVEYESRREQLLPGCSLYLVSDGVLESLGDGPLADRERQLLAAASTAHQGHDELWQILSLAQQDSHPDDMACLTLTREL
jgi:phosphoserine phosphatase RsbU/P